MKKHLFLFFTIISFTVSFGQSVPNGGFESWTLTNYENPWGYGTSNFQEDNGITAGINAVKTTDAYHGSYALKLTTAVTSGTNISFAYFANGDPGKTPVQGGIPYSLKPSGVRFYYKSNINPGDSALFLAYFKKNGTTIGSYLYKIGTTQTAYTLFSANFSPALPMNPDTVVIAGCSSNAFASFGIAGNSLQIDSISFTGVAYQPAYLNGDFESWQSAQDDKLNNWFLRGGYSQTTDTYSGTYAIELQTTVQSFGGNGVSAGEANTGVNNGSGWKGGYPYTNQVDTLVFYYKYIPADPNDQGEFYTAFKKNGVQIGQTFNALTISPSYQKVSVSYSLSSAPDSINIFFRSSKYPYLASYAGSDLKLDNLYLTSQKIPISNFISPVSGCVGRPIQLTDNSNNMANAWGWIMPGASPGSSTAQNPVVIYNSTGTKTISMVASNQFGSGSLVSKTITINAIPAVASTSTITACGGGNAVLTATGAATYTWSTGSNSASITVNPTVTTTYTVSGTTSGCVNTATGAVVVPGVARPDICMVTVDSLNQFNEIYWDKTLYPNLDSMIIYREVISNTYKQIGAVSKNALSMWVDTARSIGPANGDPNISTYRYKIQVRDTCGVYGPKSLWHNTVYFTHSNGTFFWTNNYMIEGPVNPVQTYSLMVCPNPTASLTYSLVGTTTGNQSTLNDPFYNYYQSTADWRVFADLGYSCNATLKTTLTKASKSRSNVQNNRTIGINELNLKNKLRVYPNPTQGALNIELANVNDDVDIKLTDVLGQTIYSDKISKGTGLKVINTAGYAKGVYTLTVNSQGGKTAYKIVVE